MDSSPENVDDERDSGKPLTHHPTAPLHESFDISTALDPSYVISTIRKLLPSDEALVQGGSDLEKVWEDCGCILWDLSASEEHAQFMVQNLILEVLLANIVVSPSSRITEICLGIIGNISCHEALRGRINSTNGLVGAVAEQLLLDDVPCLCEACRVLTLCLKGDDGVIWAEALLAEPFISRIIWIAKTALNPLLLSKIVGLLLAVSENDAVSPILLLPLMESDLSSLLINLLAFEMGKLREERQPERFEVMDMILRTLEALSTVEGYSREISLNRTLWQLAKEIIELPDKLDSCVTAAVLIANMIADSAELASLLSQDVSFVGSLLDVFPLASSDDPEARSAIWSITAGLLTAADRNGLTPLGSLVSVLTEKSEQIEDQLLDRSWQHRNVEFTAIKKVADVMRRWKLSDEDGKNNSKEVDRLLTLCDQQLIAKKG